ARGLRTLRHHDRGGLARARAARPAHAVRRQQRAARRPSTAHRGGATDGWRLTDQLRNGRQAARSVHRSTEQQMAQTHKVDIQNMQFNPASLTIAKGDSVEWTNRMGFPHTVKPDNDEFPGSGPIGPNKTFLHLFDTAGAVAYHCEIHPQMKAKVVVT